MTNETLTLIIIPILGLALPFLATQIGYWYNRRKTTAEADSIEINGQQVVVDGAVTVVTMLRAELEEERNTRRAIVDELRRELQREREDRQKDSEACSQKISLRDAEITILKRELNKLYQQIKTHENQIKKLKRDTNDLALRTPPPQHNK